MRSVHVSRVGSFGIGLRVALEYEGFEDQDGQWHAEHMSFDDPPSKLNYFLDAEQYLKDNYRTVYNNWVQANSFVKQYNEGMEAAIVRLRLFTQSQMRLAYPNLQAFESLSQIDRPTSNYYDLPALLGAFHDDLISEEPFEPQRNKDGSRFCLTTEFKADLLVTDNEEDADVKRLQKVLDAVRLQPSIKQSFDGLYTIRARLRDYLATFSNQLKIVCEKIDLDYAPEE